MPMVMLLRMPMAALDDNMMNATVNSDDSKLNLHVQTYGPSLGSGGYASGAADDRPELRSYYLGEFGRKLKLELHCITSQVRATPHKGKSCNIINPAAMGAPLFDAAGISRT